MEIEVRYGDELGQRDFKLLEVDEALLEELLQSRLVIKGDVDDEAVLCTSSKTYAIKFVSTSNTLLLVPPECCKESSNRYDVAATDDGHLELVEIAPRLDKLKELVSKKPYDEDSAQEQLEDGVLCSWNQLLDTIQASDRQLKEALSSLGAVEVGGVWRTVDPSYTQTLLEVMVLTAIQHGWNLASFPVEDMVSVLEDDGYPAQLVRHCLSSFAAQSPSCSSSSLLALHETKICLHYARQLLPSCSRWKVEDFLEAWQQRVPSGFKVNVDMLKGEALVNKLGSETWLHQFSVSGLPNRPADRFAALFKEKPKWDWVDLEPYLRDLCIPGLSVEAMLLKYTRKIQPTAESSPVYTAR